MYAAGLKAGIPDSVIMDIVYIYGWDIDFIHDIRPGDSYSLIYEEVLVEGQKEVDGNVLIAEFSNQGKLHTAIRYDLEPGRSEYFSPEGNNVKKAFLRSPVKFSYISSKYNLKRKHPSYTPSGLIMELIMLLSAALLLGQQGMERFLLQE